VYLRAGVVPVARVDDRLDQIGSSPIDHAVINPDGQRLRGRRRSGTWQHEVGRRVVTRRQRASAA
jgi:hypothetical protein